MLARFLKLFFVSLVVLNLISFAHADEIPEVMFILDSSGSMAGSSGFQSKMAAAKSVFEKIVPQLPPEVPLGLAAYGHREKQDCDDVEILIVPGEKSRDELLVRVNELRPKGMTPIANSVTKIAQLIKDRDAETTIILISDGKETCGGDPCSMVRELKNSGVNFVMHVVGFDVSNKEKQELECIAQAGGGQYFGAANAQALLGALETVNREISQKVKKVTSKKIKKSSGLGKLRITLPESGLKALGGIRISRLQDQKKIKEGELDKPDSTHPLMAGKYQLTMLYSNPNYKPPTEAPLAEFEIIGGEETIVPLGCVVYNLADELNDLSVHATALIDSETGKSFLITESHGNDYYLFKPKAVPAGTYDIGIRPANAKDPYLVKKNVVVSPGKETVVNLDSGISLTRPESVRVTGWDLVADGQTKPDLTVTRRWDNEEPLWRMFIVAPGTYDLLVRVKDMEEPLPVAQGIEIKEGELLEFDTGL